MNRTPREISRPAALRSLAALLALLACKPAATTPPAGLPPKKPADPPAAASQGLRGPVVSLEVTGLGGDRQATATEAISTRVGAPYDPNALAADVRALWRRFSLADVQVDARPAAGGVALRYRVREHPQLRKLEFQGGPALYLDTFRSRRPPEGAYDPAVLSRLAEEIRADLSDHGFLDALVTWRTVDAGQGSVDVVVATEAGPQVKLGALEIRGNKRLKIPELQQILKKRGVAVGQPFPRPALDLALTDVLTRYQQLGHMTARVAETRDTRSPDGAQISLTLVVEEGDQYRIGKLEIRGSGDAAAVRRELGLREGEVFDQVKVRGGFERLRAAQKARDAPEPGARIENVDPRRKTVHLLVEFPASTAKPADLNQ